MLVYQRIDPYVPLGQQGLNGPLLISPWFCRYNRSLDEAEAKKAADNFIKQRSIVPWLGSPFVNIQKTDGKITILNGKTYYFYGPFPIAMLVYQRVTCSWKKFCTMIKNGINQLSAGAGFVLSTVAMENGPFIDGLPSKNCDFPDFPWHVVILTIYHTSESSLVIKHRNGKSPIHRGGNFQCHV